MKKLYKFSRGFGRMGILDGVFTATEKEIDEIVGETVHFGEVLGKHSDIHVTIRKEDFTPINVSEQFIKEWDEIGSLESGYNPFDYRTYEEEDGDAEM